MRLAVISDIHANFEALDACLHKAEELGVDAFACLGDVVGYNASPNECCDRVRELEAPTIQGNHDNVACGLADPIEVGFNPAAESAIRWTSSVLTTENREWLRSLPDNHIYSDRVYLCHGSPRDQNEYILTPLDLLENAAMVLEDRSTIRVVFFGHTHLPALINVAEPLNGEPESDKVQLTDDTLWFVNPGSVGQPRDGRPESAFAVYDDQDNTIEFVRVPYDIDAVTKKNDRARIDPFLSERLRLGI